VGERSVAGHGETALAVAVVAGQYRHDTYGRQTPSVAMETPASLATAAEDREEITISEREYENGSEIDTPTLSDEA